MKTARTAALPVGKIALVSLLAIGMVGSAITPSWADRGRSEVRYEYRDRDGGQRVESRERVRTDHRHQRGTVVRELPRGHRTVIVNQTRYYVHEHRYYTRSPGGYVLVRPPVGAVVATLPVGSISVTIGGVLYSRYDDVYYRPAPRGYVVVAPPVPVPVIVNYGNVVVWTSALNVRTGPGLHFPVVYQVRQGQTLFVSAHDSGWYYVQLPNGTYGWVMSDYTRRLGAG